MESFENVPERLKISFWTFSPQTFSPGLSKFSMNRFTWQEQKISNWFLWLESTRKGYTDIQKDEIFPRHSRFSINWYQDNKNIGHFEQNQLEKPNLQLKMKISLSIFYQNVGEMRSMIIIIKVDLFIKIILEWHNTYFKMKTSILKFFTCKFPFP